MSLNHLMAFWQNIKLSLRILRYAITQSIKVAVFIVFAVMLIYFFPNFKEMYPFINLLLLKYPLITNISNWAIEEIENLKEIIINLDQAYRSIVSFAIPMFLFSLQLSSSRYSGKLSSFFIKDQQMLKALSRVFLAYILIFLIANTHNIIPSNYWIVIALIIVIYLFRGFWKMATQIAFSVLNLNPVRILNSLVNRGNNIISYISSLVYFMRFRCLKKVISKKVYTECKKLNEIIDQITRIAIVSTSDLDIDLVKQCNRRSYILWTNYEKKICNEFFVDCSIYNPHLYQKDFEQASWLGEKVLQQCSLTISSVLKNNGTCAISETVFKHWQDENMIMFDSLANQFLIKSISSEILPDMYYSASLHGQEKLCNLMSGFVLNLYNRIADRVKTEDLSDSLKYLGLLEPIIDCSKDFLTIAVSNNSVNLTRNVFELVRCIHCINTDLYNFYRSLTDSKHESACRKARAKEGTELLIKFSQALHRGIVESGIESIYYKYFNSCQEIIKQLTFKFAGALAPRYFEGFVENGWHPLGVHPKFIERNERENYYYHVMKFYIILCSYQYLHSKIAYRGIDVGSLEKTHNKVFSNGLSRVQLLQEDLINNSKYWDRLFTGQFIRCINAVFGFTEFKIPDELIAAERDKD